MQAQLARAGRPGPKAIGIDEISIRKGHSYRIVVSDLIRRRPIWSVGRIARRRAWRSSTTGWARRRAAGIRLAVMDMWKAVSQHDARTGRRRRRCLFDKFHIIRHLGEALDKVRKTEYARLSGKGRRFIKAEIHAARAPREPQPGGQEIAQAAAGGEQAAEHGLRSEKESFGQLWDYEREGWRGRSSRTGARALKWAAARNV